MMAAETDVPHVIFGAGEQADHVVRLMEWMGLPTSSVDLYDDGFPNKRVGPSGRPVLGTIGQGIERCVRSRERVLIAIGTKGAAFRYALYQRLKHASVPLASLIHPSAVIAPSARFGENVVVMPGCVVSKAVHIGALSCLFAGVILEHDTVVGENVTCGPSVVTAGHAHVGRHAFIGVGAVISAGVSVGDRALIGAGAVVVSDIPPGVVAIGVPARVHSEVPEGSDAPTAEALRVLGCEP